MKKSELIKLLANVNDEDSIDEILQGTDLVKEFIKNGLTLEAFKGKLKEKEFKDFINGEGGKDFEKRLKEWKKNNLEKELEPFIQEKYPDLIIDPTQKKILELEKELEKEREANARKDLLTNAIKYASEKGLTADMSNIIEKLLGEDLEATKAEIDSFIETINPWVSEQVDERLGASSWIPGGNGGNATSNLGSEAAKRRNEKSELTKPEGW